MSVHFVAVCLVTALTAYLAVHCLQRIDEIAKAHPTRTVETAREMMTWFFTGVFAVLAGGVFAFFQYHSYLAGSVAAGFTFFCGFVSYIIVPSIAWLSHAVSRWLRPS